MPQCAPGPFKFLSIFFLTARGIAIAQWVKIPTFLPTVHVIKLSLYNISSWTRNIGKEMKSKLIKISYQNKEISQNHQESDAFSEPVSTSSTRHGLALCYFSVKFKLYAWRVCLLLQRDWKSSTNDNGADSFIKIGSITFTTAIYLYDPLPYFAYFQDEFVYHSSTLVTLFYAREDWPFAKKDSNAIRNKLPSHLQWLFFSSHLIIWPIRHPFKSCYIRHTE